MWIVARFSPIEWRITRPPMCDNYFADRMRRKRAKCDCQLDKSQKSDARATDECHTNQEADVQRKCTDSSSCISTSTSSDDDFDGDDDERNVDCGAVGVSDGCDDASGIGADSNAIGGAHEHRSNTAKHKLNKRFRSTKDMGDDAKQRTTPDHTQPNDSGDSLDCNETTTMLAHGDRDHDCCGTGRHTGHGRAHCATDDTDRRRTHADASHANDCGHQLHFSQSMRGHHSFDSYVDTHICDYIDCDGFQETELLCSENDFTLTNSFWFSIGTLMQQGSDLNPKVQRFNVHALAPSPLSVSAHSQQFHIP